MHAVKPAQSIKLLFNHRDEQTHITKSVIEKIPLFSRFTDFEKSSISHRSTKTFTFSSIHQATKELITLKNTNLDTEMCICLATQFWQEVIQYIPGWLNLLEGKTSAYQMRQHYIHAHGITLQALARVGNILLQEYPEDWQNHLSKLIYVEWSRNNLAIWDGRALVSGKINKSRNNLILVTNYIQKVLGIPLSDESQRIENLFMNSFKVKQNIASNIKEKV